MVAGKGFSALEGKLGSGNGVANELLTSSIATRAVLR